MKVTFVFEITNGQNLKNNYQVHKCKQLFWGVKKKVTYNFYLPFSKVIWSQACYEWRRKVTTTDTWLDALPPLQLLSDWLLL